MHNNTRVNIYIDGLPDAEREVAQAIRELLEELVPGAEEKFSFKIPFYHYFGMFCYLNYQSRGGGVELAFCRGKDLVLAFPELDMKNRTMIAGITFFQKQEINRSFLQTLIAEAAAWQREAWMAKKPFVKKSKGKPKS